MITNLETLFTQLIAELRTSNQMKLINSETKPSIPSPRKIKLVIRKGESSPAKVSAKDVFSEQTSLLTENQTAKKWKQDPECEDTNVR